MVKLLLDGLTDPEWITGYASRKKERDARSHAKADRQIREEEALEDMYVALLDFLEPTLHEIENNRTKERHLAKNSIKQYRSMLARFIRWCESEGISPRLPHNPVAVAFYLIGSLGVEGAKSVKQTCAAIADAHHRADLPDPTAEPIVIASRRFLLGVLNRKYTDKTNGATPLEAS